MLWHRLAGTAPIQPLTWEPQDAAGAALKIYIYIYIKGGGNSFFASVYKILSHCKKQTNKQTNKQKTSRMVPREKREIMEIIGDLHFLPQAFLYFQVILRTLLFQLINYGI